MLIGTSNRRPSEIMWCHQKHLCRSACSSSSPHFKVSAKEVATMLPSGSDIPRASTRYRPRRLPILVGQCLVMSFSLSEHWTAPFSSGSTEVPQPSVAGKTNANVSSPFQSRRYHRGHQVQTELHALYGVFDGVRLHQARRRRGLLESSGYVLHISIHLPVDSLFLLANH